jgi:Thymidylate synthase complementing protein
MQMKVESKLILASKNSVTGVNLYTFVVTYPRVILAEVNTHRMLSRNTASSRAIPSKKQRERVIDNPFVPISIGANQKGMQAGEELTGWRRTVAIQTWKLARYPMVLASWILDKVGAHKQVVNRIVEPWTWTQQIVTCTDLKNVFKLRNHKDAEPHFHELARQMQAQVEYADWSLSIMASGRNPSLSNLPAGMSYQGVGALQVIDPGQWHLPFIEAHDDIEMPHHVDTLKKVSTARCARVSYYLPESGKRSIIERDVELCDRLSSSGHWSPFEHVATPMDEDVYLGNFRSWRQYRKEYAEEHGGDRE